MNDSNFPGLIYGLDIFLQKLKGSSVFDSASHNIISAVNYFADRVEEALIWSDAIDILADHQFAFTDDLTYDLATKITDPANCKSIESIIEDYYFSNNNEKMETVITRCLQSNWLDNYNILFKEVLCSYRDHCYQITCIGLLSIMDGLLSDASKQIKNTSFSKRLNAIVNKKTEKVMLSNTDRKILCIYTCLEKINETAFSNSDFSKEEPDYLNRHWIVHGRTHRTYTRLDFLKIILWIDATLFLCDLEKYLDERGGEA